MVTNGNSGLPERWNVQIAPILRQACGLYGEAHRRNMAWCKMAVERGATKGVLVEDIIAAIRGLHRVFRVSKPWEPCKVFKRANRALFNQAMSEGRKLAGRDPQTLKSIIRELGR